MITRLKVKNFRSLKDIDLPLGRLTVLIGANGSGKSNILEALKLVQELVAKGRRVQEVFAERGGYSEVVWGGETDREIEVELSWEDKAAKDASAQAYTMKLTRDVQGDAVFAGEELSTSEGSILTRTPVQYETKPPLPVRRVGTFQHLSAGTSVLSELPSPSILHSMVDWAFYRFNPVFMRRPQPVRKEYRLNESGENLSTVIHALFSDGDPVLDEIVDVVRACVHTVEKLSSPITADGKTYVALREQSVPKAVGSWGLSDGTLLALALATALVTPKPPSLIALEAPDIELHPYAMETLAELLTIASRKTQVITTTHSPYLLDWLPPESFVVVEKVNGATRCKPLKGKRILKQVMKDLGAGRAWYSGHIGGVP